MKHLATKDYPIRASHLPTLMGCLWKFLMIYTQPQHLDNSQSVDGGNEAAQTGSILHKMIETWYHGGNPHSIDTKKWPKGDFSDAQYLFSKYIRDPRNQIKPILVEKEFKITLAPHSEDKTKEPVHIWGHLDQVREFEPGFYKVWDVKSTKYPGYQSICQYITQIAAYTLGARHLMETENVFMGGLILPRQYNEKLKRPETKPMGVFYGYTGGSQNLNLIMEPIRHKIALLRKGIVYAESSNHCTYCFAGGPDQCLELLDTVKNPNKPQRPMNIQPMELDFILNLP